MKQTQLAIVGSGPAGYGAAVYVARAELAPLIFAGSEPGGQLMKTTEVENYPGFPSGVVGPQLMGAMQEQAEKFGSELIWETVTKITGDAEHGFTLSTDGGNEYQARAVILSMGARSKLLGVGEERYWGKGFSTCAVCDAAFYKDKEVYVVGGGDSAIEDAWALTKFAKSVTIIVRGTEFRASKIMQKRALDNPDKIKILWQTNLTAIRGEKVEQLVLQSVGKEVVVPAEGLFFAIGHEPATGFLLESDVGLDAKGYVKTGMTESTSDLWLHGYPTMTSVSGIFAGGDCVDFRYRQAVTAAGMGVSAALDAEKWLSARE